jgi:hypothetical protein
LFATDRIGEAVIDARSADVLINTAVLVQAIRP